MFRIYFVILFVCASMATFSQNLVSFTIKPNSTQYTTSNDDGKNYYIFDYPNFTKQELFSRAKMAIFDVSTSSGLFSDPSEVTDNLLYVRANVDWDNSWVRYAIILRFKDGRIRVDAPIIIGANTEINNFPKTKLLEINTIINKVLSCIEEPDW